MRQRGEQEVPYDFTLPEEDLARLLGINWPQIEKNLPKDPAARNEAIKWFSQGIIMGQTITRNKAVEQFGRLIKQEEPDKTGQE